MAAWFGNGETKRIKNQITASHVLNCDFTEPFGCKVIHVQVLATIPKLVTSVIVPQLDAVLPQVPISNECVTVDLLQQKLATHIGQLKSAGLAIAPLLCQRVDHMPRQPDFSQATRSAFDGAGFVFGCE